MPLSLALSPELFKVSYLRTVSCCKSMVLYGLVVVLLPVSCTAHLLLPCRCAHLAPSPDVALLLPSRVKSKRAGHGQAAHG